MHFPIAVVINCTNSLGEYHIASYCVGLGGFSDLSYGKVGHVF